MNIINLLVRNFVTMSKISRGPRKRTWNLIISTVGIRIPAIGSNASQASGTFADVEAHVFGIVDGGGACRRHLSVPIAAKVDGL